MASSPRLKSVGDYKLIRPLGIGGQGHVWRAKSPTAGVVALKLFKLPYDKGSTLDLRRRVKREFDALQQATHPNVATALDTGEDAENLYIAYELVDGSNVREALASAAPPSVDDCLAFAEAAASGLDHLHSQGIFHRDVKPDNIMLRNHRWGAPVLVDLGLAKPVDASRLTVTGLVVGTQNYLAPEVLGDPGAASPASDLWSFACVVGEVLLVAMDLDPADFEQFADRIEACEENAPACAKVLRRATSEVRKRYSCTTEFAKALGGAARADGLAGNARGSPSSTLARQKRESLTAYFERMGCTIVSDRRAEGGCLWVFGEHALMRGVKQYLASQDIQLIFAKGGGRATGHRPAWFTKSPD